MSRSRRRCIGGRCWRPRVRRWIITASCVERREGDFPEATPDDHLLTCPDGLGTTHIPWIRSTGSGCRLPCVLLWIVTPTCIERIIEISKSVAAPHDHVF